RPRRRSASKFQTSCWPLPTRSSNDREDETARLHHASRRRDDGVAARGARAAAGDAGDRVSQHQGSRRGRTRLGRVSPGPDRDRLCRGSERYNRIPLGGRSQRSSAGIGGRSAASSQATVAAKAATTTIPIVFATGADPVQVGFVASLNQPRGNLTGVTSLDTELGRKRLRLLHELLPNVGTIAALVNPTFPDSDIQAREL